MTKRKTYHPDIIHEIIVLLNTKGIKAGDNIPVEAWNMAYDCVHAQHSIEMIEWKHNNLTVAL